MIERLLYFISYIFNIIPISKNLIVFTSYPDFTDNSYAVYEYIRKKNKYKCVWLFNDKDYKEKYPSINGCYRLSLKGIFLIYRSRYIFCTHGINSFLQIARRDKVVNLWHGMPLKNIGSLENNNFNPTKADYLIATSTVFRDIMSRAFNNFDKNRILILGQPRNDLLFSETDFYKNRNISKKNYLSVGIWLPTFRKSIYGEIRQDGIYNEGVSFLSLSQLYELDEFLKNNNRLLICKLHPMDALQNVFLGKFSNLIILKQSDLKEQLYPLLGSADYLLTDYSSVWIDYSILKRPIGFLMNDYEEYKNSRGFTIDNLPELLPGNVIDTMEDLCKFIIEQPPMDIKNLHLFNKYHDNKSTERIVNYFNI